MCPRRERRGAEMVVFFRLVFVVKEGVKEGSFGDQAVQRGGLWGWDDLTQHLCPYRPLNVS